MASQTYAGKLVGGMRDHDPMCEDIRRAEISIAAVFNKLDGVAGWFGLQVRHCDIMANSAKI